MKIVRRDPMSYVTPFGRWPSLLDDEWFEDSNNLTVYETDDDLVVKAHISGVPAESVDVSIEGGVITIKAEHEETEEEKKKRKVVYREARRSQYLYTTNIPSPVQADKARAEVVDGVLTLTIPKAEEAKPKRIKVSAQGK